MSRFLIRERLLTLTETYDIYDEDGDPVYAVRHELFSLPRKTRLFDKATGLEIGHITQKMFSLFIEYAIDIRGKTLGSIRKKITFFKPALEADFDNLKIEGNLWGMDFKCYSGSELVFEVSKQYLSFGDTYVVDVLNDEYDEAALLMTVALDEIYHGRNN